MTAEKTVHSCSHCSKKFKYDSERKRHEQSHFPQFQCKICSKNFSFISALRRHEKQHERKGTVTCEECSREFRDQILLKRHTKYAHAGSYTCSKCDTVFYSEPALRTHMQTHKVEAERRYQCSFEGCGKKFNFAHHLKHHELTHTNSKQHYCKICGKGFIQSHHLKTHLKTHTADSSLYCTFPDCNKRFATEYAKKRHVAKYHIKTDSGISSDSNSAYDMSAKVTKEQFSTRDETTPSIASIISKTEHDTTVVQTDDCVELAEDLSITSDYKQSTSINDLTDCKLALGTCIMSEEKCVCVELTKTVTEDYDFTPVEDETINLNKLTINNDCGELCCGGKCGGNKEIAPQDEMPVIEYKTDGTVKIKEFLDIDFSVDTKSEVKFVPYNSCKAVLGNCIVSGNGTIGDGCLCAKMIVDDQVTAQEIEDITPHPCGGMAIDI
ncbi:uncharacterized protein LOC142979984 [Anticarsia gemmatalis]|uniref:uncharacterized protein LOC142979984 n=1 Tax=Anticarsia gemmatalis TaxID=129554 RepID=UPI003F766612